MIAPERYEPPTRIVDHEPEAYSYRWMSFFARYWKILLPMAVITIVIIGTWSIFHGKINFDIPIIK